MRVAIVLLAAGTSSRFGSLKQLEVLHGRSLVRRAADTALATGLPLWVVTGAQDARVRAELAGLSLTCVHNPDWARGMGGSLSCGVRAAQGTSSAVIVLLADQPLIETDDLHALMREHAAHAEAIVAAEYGGVIGPPCLFPARDFPALVALEGDRGARALIRQQPERVRRVALPHAALDIDTPEDLERARGGF